MFAGTLKGFTGRFIPKSSRAVAKCSWALFSNSSRVLFRCSRIKKTRNSAEAYPPGIQPLISPHQETVSWSWWHWQPSWHVCRYLLTPAQHPLHHKIDVDFKISCHPKNLSSSHSPSFSHLLSSLSPSPMTFKPRHKYVIVQGTDLHNSSNISWPSTTWLTILHRHDHALRGKKVKPGIAHRIIRTTVNLTFSPVKCSMAGTMTRAWSRSTSDPDTLKSRS